MLRKRIIFTLIYSNGSFMQSRNFRLQRVGDINWLEKNYQFQKISFSLDELIVLDATKGNKLITEFAKTVNRLVDDVFIPVAAGGGIRSMEDAALLFNNGADKIVLNSSFVDNSSLVEELVQKYGSQSIVGCIDYRCTENGNEVYIHDGTTKIDYSLEEYVAYVERLRVGEIYLNSIDQDGTGFGYDIKTIEEISKKITVPLIVAGGAGNELHFIDGLNLEHVSAVATANLFNFIGDGLPKAREKIITEDINIARWN